VDTVDRPFIVFAADACRVTLLIECAIAAGVALDERNDGLLVTWSPSVVEMLGFARHILERASELEALPTLVDRADGAIEDT
jgi:hypothetical protein